MAVNWINGIGIGWRLGQFATARPKHRGQKKHNEDFRFHGVSLPQAGGHFNLTLPPLASPPARDGRWGRGGPL